MGDWAWTTGPETWNGRSREKQPGPKTGGYQINKSAQARIWKPRPKDKKKVNQRVRLPQVIALRAKNSSLGGSALRKTVQEIYLQSFLSWRSPELESAWIISSKATQWWLVSKRPKPCIAFIPNPEYWNPFVVKQVLFHVGQLGGTLLIFLARTHAQLRFLTKWVQIQWQTW